MMSRDKTGTVTGYYVQRQHAGDVVWNDITSFRDDTPEEAWARVARIRKTVSYEYRVIKRTVTEEVVERPAAGE